MGEWADAIQGCQHIRPFAEAIDDPLQMAAKREAEILFESTPRLGCREVVQIQSRRRQTPVRHLPLRLRPNRLHVVKHTYDPKAPRREPWAARLW